jgi:hypothetical protein
LPKQPKCNNESQNYPNPIRVIGTDDEFALHEGMKEAASVRATVTELARFLDINSNFRSRTPIVTLRRVANPKDRVFGLYLGVYVVTFKVKAMSDIP